MYVNIVNQLGPTFRTQKWIHEQAISERYNPRTKGGIRGFVHRYLTAVQYEQEHCMDNLLKNLLCESTTSLVELVRSNYQNSENPFKDACDHLLKYYYEQQWSRNQEFITPPTYRPRRTQAAVAENVDTSESSGDERVAAYGHQQGEGYRVSDKWWTEATPEEKDELRKMRLKIKARGQSKNDYQTTRDPERLKKPSILSSNRETKVQGQQAVAMTYPDSDFFEEDVDDDSAVEQLS
jgi:hypothetical protein